MVKNIQLTCLFLASFFCCLHSQAQCLTTSLTINTAYDPTTGLGLPAGSSGAPSVDPHWIVVSATSSIPGAAATGSPAYIIPSVGGWVANPTTNPGRWISVTDSVGYNTDGGSTVYTMTLGRPFRMCSADSVTLTLKIANDNYLSVLDVDGSITLSFSQSTPVAANFNTFSTFSQTIYLAAGTHTLRALVNNYNQAGTPLFNPSGLDIYGTISSATGTPSLVYEGDPACATYACGTTTACGTINLVDSIAGCAGITTPVTATITGVDSVVKVRWSPPAGISDTTILSPVISAATSAYYYLVVNSLLPGNFVLNGNFSSGNVGFTSSYTYQPGPSSVLYEGYYSVYTNPMSVHSGFTSFADHTTGSGNMLIINGGSTATDIWCETIPVTPNTDYDFSAWVANCSSTTTGAYAPILQFKINGSLIGTPYTVTASAGTWVNFQNIWNSGSNTVANICIYDALTAATGNDFAIDDITFKQYCTIKDSVYVNITTPDTVYNHRDTSVCASVGTITLSAPAGYTSYVWNTGSTSPTLSVSASGFYYVYCTLGCHVLIDTVAVTMRPYIVTTNIIDTGYCFPGSIKLVATPGFVAYTWGNGSTANTFTATTNAVYYVVGTGDCRLNTDSFRVAVRQLTISLGPDTTVCMNYTIVPSVKDDEASYKWQDGYTGGTYSASHTGTYYATVKVGGCIAADTVDVTFFHFSQNIPDTFICKGTPIAVTVTATPPPGGTVLWNDGIITASRTLTDSGTYWVYVNKDECAILDTVRVTTGYCDCWYNVPDAFSPNADGLNDVIRPFIQPGCTISGYQFSIFNRWGETVFMSDFPGKGWDGQYKGMPADIGVYYYTFQFFKGINDKPVQRSGSVTLIR
ncbi:MAG: gliding motility-associated C-terminal domain-containing protein [Taibaiella sp.]|nr:gliding motility-associated C-terminal domain-containing protein [Taibaiella sp.]